MKVNGLEIRKPWDAHLHLRTGTMMSSVLPYSTEHFAGGLIMPNTKPEPIRTAYESSLYKISIGHAVEKQGLPSFEATMAVELTEKTGESCIRDIDTRIDARALMVYPRGVTTNSEDGVLDYSKIYPLLKVAEEIGVVVCFHPEVPDLLVEPLDREKRFIEILNGIVKSFPNLRVVVEHVTSSEMINWISEQSERPSCRIGATITPHHLLLTLADVIGYSKESKGLLSPHNFCKPIAKSKADRKALVAAVLSGNPRFFLGTDSAPHPKDKKECAECCAGVFSAPVAIPILAQVFDEMGSLDKLENFCSVYGPEFYGLNPSENALELRRMDWTVPSQYSIALGAAHHDEVITLVPFMAGRKLAWQADS